MKRILLIMGLTIVGMATTTAQTPAPTADETLVVRVGDVAPDFEVQMTDGTTVRLSDLRGKVVLLTFWATWCPDCVQELAHIVPDILPKMTDKNFVFLPISTRERKSQMEAVANFMNLKGYTFVTGLDADSSIYKRYATNYVPRNFLINKQGIVIAESTDEGFEQVENKLMEVIK